MNSQYQKKVAFESMINDFMFPSETQIKRGFILFMRHHTIKNELITHNS